MRRVLLVGVVAVVVTACGGETSIGSGTTTATGGGARTGGSG
jgi:hypothetical protein